MNLMCEKVGEPCICRLARVLSLTPEIERLDLGKNDLTALPEEVFKLRNLRSLDLSYNRLSTLPSSILQLSQLEVLVLEGNPVVALEKEEKQKKIETSKSSISTPSTEDEDTAALVEQFINERIKKKM